MYLNHFGPNRSILVWCSFCQISSISPFQQQTFWLDTVLTYDTNNINDGTNVLKHPSKSDPARKTPGLPLKQPHSNQKSFIWSFPVVNYSEGKGTEEKFGLWPYPNIKRANRAGPRGSGWVKAHPSSGFGGRVCHPLIAGWKVRSCLQKGEGWISTDASTSVLRSWSVTIEHLWIRVKSKASINNHFHCQLPL